MLLSTVWILAVLALVVGYFAARAEESVRKANDALSDLAATIDRRSTINTVLHLLSTRGLKPRGLEGGPPAFGSADNDLRSALIAYPEELPYVDSKDDSLFPANGTLIRGVGHARFALQDEAGLLDLYERTHVEALFSELGLQAREIETLHARMADYVDTDTLYRVNGAEASEYRKAGLPEPLNRPLISTWETRAILGWQDRLEPYIDDIVAEYATANWKVSYFNPKTAPAAVQKLLGFTDAGATYDNSEDGLPMELAQDRSASGNRYSIHRLSPDQVFAFPSRYFRLRVGSENSNVVEELHIELTPVSFGGGPWKIHSAFAIDKSMAHSFASPDSALDADGEGWRLFDERTEDHAFEDANRAAVSMGNPN